MSDVAAGGQAALQLQQQMAAAPNVQQVEANKMQEQQLILQQNEAKLQQEAATLQKTKLANLVLETGIKGDEESKQKLQNLYKTTEFQTALNDNNYGDIIRLTGGTLMSSGKVEEGAKILVQASTFDAKRVADKQKMMDQNAQEIGNAYGVLSAIDPKNPQKIEESFTNLPKESRDAIISQVGESNWKRFTPQEKLEATKNLMLNAKGQLATQLKLADLERQILINESKERVNQETNKTRLAAKELGDGGIKQDREKRLAWEETTRAITSIEKSGSKTLDRLNEAVDAADAAVIKNKPGSLASFFGATGDFDTANELLTKAKTTRDDFQKKQIKKQLDIALSAPDFSSKAIVVKELQTQLAALGGVVEPTPLSERSEKSSGAPMPQDIPGLGSGDIAPKRSSMSGQRPDLRMDSVTNVLKSDPRTAPAQATAKAVTSNKQMSEEDKQALEWAKANPSDPRAAKIRQRLGG